MMKIKIKQATELPTKTVIDKESNLIIALPDLKAGKTWPDFPYADILKQRISRSGDKAPGKTPLTSDLPNEAGTHVTLVGIKNDLTSFEMLTLARKLTALHLKQDPPSIAVLTPGLAARSAMRMVEAIVAASLAGSYDMPSYKSSKKTTKRLKLVTLYGLAEKFDHKRTIAEAEGNNLARYLTALPPNELTPAIYRQRISTLAKENGWKMQFLDSKALQRKKAGAFLAVSQGSPEQDAGIVRLQYTPARGAGKKAVALVGKGICFDTGGMNLKPAKFMHGMHEDMEGSAVALGTLLTLTRLKVPFPVHCWLALAENHIGPHAYKQNDVVTAMNGTTIEIMHTDAEGRMVLADTLALASKEKPGVIIDYATLTGACVYSLSTRYSGAFTNRDEFVPELIAAGRASGERVWPFPTDEDFDSDLDSSIADVKQCTLGGNADHILAARFLQRFVDDTPWIHIDLSAGNHKGGLAHIPTDTTGFGVRFTSRLLLEHNIPGNVK